MSLKAIILAAGHGTRMKSDKPKVLHEILGKPMVRYAIDAAKDAGASKVVTVVGFGKEQIEPVAEDTTIALQEEMLGTGDAVKSAIPSMDLSSGSVLITYGDCPLITSDTLRSLVELREKNGSALVISVMRKSNPFGYGRIVRDESGKIVKNIEEKDCSETEKKIEECNAGFYCFDAKILQDTLSKISNDNAQGEYYLTDAIEILAGQGSTVDSFEIEDKSELYGVNSRLQLAEATKIMQNRINRNLMDEGVGILDPDTTYISPDAEILADVEIWPNTYILGSSRVETGSVVGPNSRIVDTRIGKDCKIDETIAYESVIEDGATTGPRCYLRPGAHLCKGAKAGTSVEIKKSTVGEGSKVPHLSYIGDTTIESGVNLGAGTITCNYDGKNKHKTHIGKDTFVGSSTMLVAPVEVGDNVVVGAGSVITDDVPDDTLAFGRAKQVNKVGRLKYKN